MKLRNAVYAALFGCLGAACGDGGIGPLNANSSGTPDNPVSGGETGGDTGNPGSLDGRCAL